MDTGSNGAEDQQRLTRQAIDEAGLSVAQVWLRYFSLTGNAGEYEIDAYLNGLLSLPPLQRDLVSHAVNELIDGMPRARKAPYSRTLHGEGAAEGDENPEGD